MTPRSRPSLARWSKFWLAVFFLSLGLLVQLFDRPEASPGLLTVRFLDVGQGDATLIDTPDGKHLLIDGGPDETTLALLGRYLAPPNRFALVVASHNHADHIAGLIDVLDEYPVDEVWLSGSIHTSDTFQRWLTTVQRSGTRVRTVHSGHERELGAVHVLVLYPLVDVTGQRPANQHETTIVIKVSYGATSLLLTGDLEAEQEEAILGHERSHIPSNVLKVTHHGSHNASTQPFLESIHPEAAIISAGKDNKFGHPHQETLDRLSDAGIPVYRTDQNGTITITSDGLHVQVNAEHR